MLELEYLNLKTNQIQNSFAKQDLSKQKTKEEVYKAYIAYLKKKITKEKQVFKKADNILDFDAEIDARQQQKKKPSLKKTVKTNGNTSRSNKKHQ